MKSKKRKNKLHAGSYSKWLQDYLSAFRKNRDMFVPCGECDACCRSSEFIHISPRETGTLKHIPGKYLFPAPFFPKGYKVMGYDGCGCCPMLKDNVCSIYKYRPLTCRIFDCRVLAAAGIKADEKNYGLIMKQVRRWRFSYPCNQDRNLQKAVRFAAKFLKTNRSSFPAGWVPYNSIQLAMLSIMACRVFIVKNERAHNNAGIANKIMKEYKKFKNSAV